MSKLSSLQKILEQTTATTRTPAVAESPAATQDSQPRSKAALAVEASREGKVHVGGYFHPQVRKSLRMVQLQTDKDFQTLILQALNDLFRAHNVPVIDN
jgi:tRNA/tmRNA/rRNA uracil-C5-methylase (TrmA/RlmC/RlmD family)